MIGTEPVESIVLFDRSLATPVGRIQFAGYVSNTWRKYNLPMRMLNCYGLIFILDGGGRFRDGLGNDFEVQEGDLILLFPDVPHNYGPLPGQTWSEFYIHFDGAVFDLWRDRGLLDPEHPVIHLPDAALKRQQLHSLFSQTIDHDTNAQVIQISQFLTLLTEMVQTGSTVAKDTELPRWVQSTLIMLSPRHDHDSISDIAKALDMPYHTFLRRFKKALGVSPAEYRNQRKIDAAKSLLAHTTMTIAEIAIKLQFADAFHFSNRFTDSAGMRPSEYRRRARSGDPQASQERASIPSND